ncbi:MAG: NUDIX hydrolase, partial [Psychrilyobacter sp.]|uniref:NUDIX hydrolase n=1 Tax=Psychrilyobacter sp. TaxID=2586924 RepID=UPI003C708B6C
MKYKHIKKDKVFENEHFVIYEEDLILPNGNQVRWTFLKDYITVGVIAFTPEGKLLLVKQYRPALKQEIIEIPAGLVDPGEDVEKAALRELEEETGYRARRITKVSEYFRSPGLSSSKMYIYHAEDLIKTSQNLDENEFLEVLKIDRNEIDEILKTP